MYYVQNNHPAIIDRVTFNKVQEELARRKTKTPGSAKSSITSTGKYSRYALTDVLICGNCGTRYRRVTWSRNGQAHRVALHQPTGLRQEILQRFPHHYGGQATGGHRSSGQQVQQAG